jgi:hypothetical protein
MLPANKKRSGGLEMLCTQCGAQVGATDEFCARCGVPLRGDGAPRAAAPADEAELVAAAIGKNTDYYLRRFEGFARGGLASWSWPAFFVLFAWLLYRKMWLHGVLYFLAGPFVYVLLVAVLAAALGAPGALLGVGLVLAVRLSRCRCSRARSAIAWSRAESRKPSGGPTARVSSNFDREGERTTSPSSRWCWSCPRSASASSRRSRSRPTRTTRSARRRARACSSRSP